MTYDIYTLSNIIHFYETLKEDDFKNVMKKNNIKYDDFIDNISFLNSELEYIQHLEYDICYERQIATSYSIIPKNYQLVLEPEILDEIMSHREDETISYINDLDQCKDLISSFDEIVVVGYKYQYKYMRKVLEEIVYLYY